jgi:hypothetical protein
MDRARAVINIKEGIIEFEGPLDFVNGKLEKYGQAIESLLGAGASRVSGRGLPQAGKRRPGRPARESKTKASTCIEALRQSVNEGFFKEPRTIGDIRNHVAGKGLSFTVRAIRAGLTRLTNAALLETSGKGRGLRYRAHA